MSCLLPLKGIYLHLDNRQEATIETVMHPPFPHRRTRQPLEQQDWALR